MSRFCNKCGSENISDATFCNSCGNAISTIDIEKPVDDEISFLWWKIWGWLGFIVGSLVILGELSPYSMAMAIGFALLNLLIMSFVLSFNKYAFLIGTVLSLNPFLWIINGIYLKNRWNHPRVNN
jgi:hypothetical protein